jgi:hypothetical protein
LTENRKLDRGSANPGNIGSDFDRLGMRFWPEVLALDARNAGRQARLETLSTWRNAIAHQDFDSAKLGGKTEVLLREVDAWRSCNSLALMFDRALADYIDRVTGSRPW